MTNVWGKLVLKFFKYAPSYVVCLCFLPCGMIFGYTICAFVAERNLNAGLIYYGPLILGACWAVVTALAMLTVKFVKKCIVYWQPWLLLAAGVFNLIGSCFYFADGFDHVGAYISYLAHSMTFVAGYSFLHTISSKGSRSLFLSGSCSCYLLGVASAVSLIVSSYSRNVKELAGQTVTTEQLIDGIYVNFAGTYLSVAAVVLAILVGQKVLHFLGTVDLVNSMDNDLRIANSNGSIFEQRSEVIKRLQFFYVTKNQQWNMMLLLLFTEAVQFALFVYFVYWFALNPAIRLTEFSDIDGMFWVIFAGSLLALICQWFLSVKVTYVSSQVALIFFTLLAMILCSLTDSRWSLWLLLVLFGLSYSQQQILLLEVTHLRFTECIICISYVLKLICTSIVYFYFVADAKNSYFLCHRLEHSDGPGVRLSHHHLAAGTRGGHEGAPDASRPAAGDPVRGVRHHPL
ncbi:GM22755 [Drosophila sechellia]|uniref:GM22755 n=1 Tax=Drosophila sechellia TaxID=7238 RepID=B4I733_DROSE|nr:GM22755 [Drosophila sechellia]